MARRGKGEGTIRLRPDGRWEARLTIEPENGKSQRRSYFGKTRTEAARKMREALNKADNHIPLPSDRLTVAAFLQTWIATKGDLRPESKRRYEDSIRLHLTPHIGKKTLTKLQAPDLLACYGVLKSQGLSGTTASHAHGVLHAALEDAVRWGKATRNVADLVKAPRRTTPEMRYLQPSEAKELLAASKGDAHEALFVVALTCGLRLGELQALRWQDVQLDRQRLTVRRTFAGILDGEPVFVSTSTHKNHERTVWLTEAAVDALERHKVDQDVQRRKAGRAWQEYGLVFSTGLGTPLDGNNIRQRYFARLLERAGLAHMRFHDLRHSAATLLLAAGVPVKVVSEVLGHTDVATTLRIYAHVIEGAQAQATSVMDQLFHS